VVVLAVVLLNALFRLLEELEVTVWDAANPSAFAVLDLDELRRHAHRRHADDDIQPSPVADDCSDPESWRKRDEDRCVGYEPAEPRSISLNAQGTTYDGATPVLQASTRVSPGNHSL
jgi:hypothetical protein